MLSWYVASFGVSLPLTTGRRCDAFFEKMKSFWSIITLAMLYIIATTWFGLVGLIATHLLFGVASIMTLMYLGWKRSNCKSNFYYGTLTQIRRWNIATTCVSILCVILGGLAILVIYHTRNDK